MQDLQGYFDWPVANFYPYYAYFVFAAVISGVLIFRSKSKFKPELFFICFYLLTGNINQILTIKIPGFNLFEIQPIRFVFLLLCILLLRKTLFARDYKVFQVKWKLPWYQLALFAYILLLIISVLVNSSLIGVAVVMKTIVDAVAFLVLIFGLRLMADMPSYELIGKAIIIGAVFSSIVSLIQFTVDPYFLRIGDVRPAFGSVLRSNGIFSTEYFHSYFLIIACGWTLLTIKQNVIKILLIGLFTLGVITSFQRMSWIILVLVLIIYAVYVQKWPAGRLIFTGLSVLTIALLFSIFNYKEIMNSSLVQERLTDNVDRRQGYYSMVLNNIGNKPFFGYGDLKNEVYYTNIMKITRSRSRATAESGDLHSGYFSSMYLYGIPAFISFVLFVVLSVWYYAKTYKTHPYFVIPFLVSFIYMMGNLTNTFLFLKYLAILYAIHIGIGMGIHQLTKPPEARKLNR